jgi:hypothetical protein
MYAIKSSGSHILYASSNNIKTLLHDSLSINDVDYANLNKVKNIIIFSYFIDLWWWRVPHSMVRDGKSAILLIRPTNSFWWNGMQMYWISSFIWIHHVWSGEISNIITSLISTGICSFILSSFHSNDNLNFINMHCGLKETDNRQKIHCYWSISQRDALSVLKRFKASHCETCLTEILYSYNNFKMVLTLRRVLKASVSLWDTFL